MKHTALLHSSLLLFTFSAFSLSAEPFKDGDRVVFLGDSITHGGSFHQYLDYMYATRCPDRTVTMFNAGWGGSMASYQKGEGVFEEDVARLKPTVVSTMYGMNDCWLSHWMRENATERDKKLRAQAQEKYAESMTNLFARIAALGARQIVMVPSPYDEWSLENGKPSEYLNAGVAQCAEKMRGWAKQYGFPSIDLQKVFTDLIVAKTRQDPGYHLFLGQGGIFERVHPGAAGHLVIAYHYLKIQGFDGKLEPVTHDAGGAASAKFTALEKSLPFPLDSNELKKGASLVPFNRDFNTELLKVTNLAEGRYFVKIDGESVGDWTAAELAKGVNLAENPRTPQFKQAARAAAINARNWGWQNQLRHSYVDGRKGKAVEADEKLLAKRRELEEKIEAGRREFRAAVKPVAHTFEIVPAKTVYVNGFESPTVDLCEFNLGKCAPYYTSETIRTTEKEHHSGRRALQVCHPLQQGFIVSFSMFRVLGDWRRADELFVPGRKYVLSAWVKCDRKDVPVEIRKDWQDKSSYKIGTEWTRLTHIFEAKKGMPTSFEIRMYGPSAAVYIDDVKCEEDEAATPYVEGEPAIDPRCNGGFRYLPPLKANSPCVKPPESAKSAIQGPLVRYTTVMPRDGVLPVRLIESKSEEGKVKKCGIDLSFRDTSGKVVWREMKPFVDGKIETSIPLTGLPLGEYVFRATSQTSQTPQTLQTSSLREARVTLAPDAPVVVRADRFRRVLMRNDEMLTGVGQGMGLAVYGMSDEEADRILQDAKSVGIRTANISAWSEKRFELDKTLKALDAYRRNGMYAFVEWGMCFYGYPCHFCGGVCYHTNPESAKKPLDPKLCQHHYDILKKIKDHPAFLGNYVIDEPCADVAWKVRKVVEAMRAVDPHHPCFPMPNNALAMPAFSDMMHELVMHDNYDRGDGGLYYSSRSVAAWTEGRPMWYYILAYPGEVMQPRVAPRHFVNIAYQVIVNGGSMIEPFVYRPWEYDLWMSWKTLSDEMKAIQPAIAAEKWWDGSNGGVAWSFRETPDALYLIVVSIHDGYKHPWIGLPKEWTGATKIERLFSNQNTGALKHFSSVNSTSFHDGLDRYDHRVYRITR